ncbi:DNA repair protein REV1 [Drosophila novamexicana]|uniref:DNA repair protein REV1 n=1 Tax=Drosophila novamexicana TaxID=47314 RepID=UPI0011E5BA3D|nr:DNA repair protein REV1 [Drosophila novamexicana]
MAREDDNGFSDWGGYFEAKKAKLEEQFAAASDPFRKSNLFDGISIFVNGLTNPSADELKRIMMVHGGTFHHYERSHTNFIIASNLPDVKVRKMDTSRIISAQWVVDCVQQKRIVDYKPYLLYTNQKTTQPRLNFGKAKNNDSTVSEGSGTLESALGGILKELQQAVATSPDKNSSTVTNVTTTTTSTSNSARTAVDPAFLSEFYKNSRLHHIATLGSGFKQYVCELRQAHGNKSFVKRTELRSQLGCKQSDIPITTPKRYVMHIDMDCFFVSVGLRKHPELRGLPLAVTHSKGGSAATDVPVHPQADRQVEQELFAQRFEHQKHDNIRADKVRYGFEKKMSLSEIASCSYEAREKGIKNGMFVGQALKLCPDLKTIPYDFEGYREVAFALYDTVAQYTLNIEAVSCDEMFVDLTDLLQELQVDVMTFVTHLRQEVRDITGCPCSAGVGDNKLLARMATKLAKPNGQHLLDTDDAAKYMASFALDVLPGVGSSMTYKLNQAGLITCADVQLVSLVRLEMLLGKKMAQTLYQNCRGIDPRPLVYEQQRKSVSAEVNYGIRFTKNEELEKFIQQLSIEVHSRLIEIKRKTKLITLKLMVRAAEAPVETSKFMGHGVCDNQTKSSLLKQSTDDVEIIMSNVLKLMKESGFPPHELRGIGIHLGKLDDIVDSKKENVIKNMFFKMSEKQKEKTLNEAVSIKKPVETKAKSANVSVLSMLQSAAANKKSSDFEPIPVGISTACDENESLVVPPTEPRKQPVEKKAKPPEVNVLTMLKNAPTAKKTGIQAIPSGDTIVCSEYAPPPLAPPAITQFDVDVLAQLPDEIRREILCYPEEYLRMTKSTVHGKRDIQAKEHEEKSNKKKRKSRSRSRSRSSSPPPPPPSMRVACPTASDLNESDLQPSTSKAALAKHKKRVCRADQIVANYVQELPQHMHPAILQYLTANNTISKVPPAPDVVAPAAKQPVKPTQHENVFVDPNYKNMLATWVKSEEVPKPADVDLMYMNICYLVEENKMDKVYEVMKYLCRLIKAKRASCCRWHMAYNEIESNIQEKVHEILDCHIYFTEAIDCYKCA